MLTIAPPQPLPALRSAGGRPPRSAARRAAWPVVVLFAGYPLWWLLGVASFLPLVLAVPMLVQLVRNGRIRVPKGMGWWLLFLVWVVASAAMLWTDAPGAEPGSTPDRLTVFLYRLAWYGACTVAMLWVGNLSEEEAPSRRIARLLGWMFVVTVAGGLLGVLAPKFELTSLMESLLPASLRSNGFVQTLTHPSAATLTTFLGREEYRPIAPFDFANSWGSNLSMFLPFFLLSWFGKGAGWRRFAAPFVLAVSVVPIVYSMNRGLWASLAVGAVFVLVRLASRGNRQALLVVIAALGLAFAAFLASPLASLSSDTLDSAHSNDRRGELLVRTVQSTLDGSPVLGFGSTRNVQGSFASIAGGSTPDCPACAVPPLGTQGHLWMVIFSQGLVGAVFFLAFLFVRAKTHWRSRTPLEAAGFTLLLFFALQMFIYDTLGLPLYTIMLGLGLIWRDQQRRQGPAASRCLASLLRPVRRFAPLLLAGAVAGGGAGAAQAAAEPTTYAAQATLLLPPSPVYLYSDGTENLRASETTVDTEAALVLSGTALARTASSVGLGDPGVIAARTTITAEATTRVINLTYTDANPTRARAVVDALANSYLSVRSADLTQRRDHVLTALREQLAGMQAFDSTLVLDVASGDAVRALRLPDASTLVMDQIDKLSLAPSSAGEIIRAAQVTPVRNQAEVNIASGALMGFLLVLTAALAAGKIRARSRFRLLRSAIPLHRKVSTRS
ncbi:hypothetical protein KIH31_07640 [Paenarthrobacter sp. DKR-5]|uniref:hypothetical protein n=1 Tax=Paenarthrobacter sp. DKR-5 TaxID=2835535 RepID=UPI001BDD2277|nr:hypothetical protein [Paenarthrobacter sp. DKR-5]MBT1002473.1 hypothetical protein [Paenarthrobacter sp. DKR-5]